MTGRKPCSLLFLNKPDEANRFTFRIQRHSYGSDFFRKLVKTEMNSFLFNAFAEEKIGCFAESVNSIAYIICTAAEGAAAVEQPAASEDICGIKRSFPTGGAA